MVSEQLLRVSLSHLHSKTASAHADSLICTSPALLLPTPAALAHQAADSDASFGTHRQFACQHK
jgi:hypothetical protein